MNLYKDYTIKSFERISYLFEQYEQRRSTIEEKKELFQWLDDHANNEMVNEFFIKGFRSEPEAVWARNEWEPLVEQILLILPDVPARQVKRIHFLPRVAAAAAVIALVVGSWWLFSNKGNKLAVADKPAKQLLKNDVAPGGNVAVLTLADGSQIMLDNAANGQLSVQGNAQVMKLANGRLSYLLKENPLMINSAVTYNTLKTPKGGQYQLVLPDGTKVWLNAASSITYPTTFTGAERKVSITGEAYFEVVPSGEERSLTKLRNGVPKPFRVSAKEMTVDVLGTQFNINAYADEPSIKTSLLEGSVKVANQLLKPGQAYENGKIIPTNVEQDVAWKNGIFNFNNKNLDQMMRQLSRWYDLEVVYPNAVPKIEFGGELKRNLNLSQILKVLKNSGVQFQLDGRRLIVKP